MFHKLQEKGIDVPFSYIINSTEEEWFELCIVYNDIYETIDKKYLKELKTEVLNG